MHTSDVQYDLGRIGAKICVMLMCRLPSLQTSCKIERGQERGGGGLRAGADRKRARLLGTWLAQWATPQPILAVFAHTTCVKCPVASLNPAATHFKCNLQCVRIGTARREICALHSTGSSVILHLVLQGFTVTQALPRQA